MSGEAYRPMPKVGGEGGKEGKEGKFDHAVGGPRKEGRGRGAGMFKPFVSGAAPSAGRKQKKKKKREGVPVRFSRRMPGGREKREEKKKGKMRKELYFRFDHRHPPGETTKGGRRKREKEGARVPVSTRAPQKKRGGTQGERKTLSWLVIPRALVDEGGREEREKKKRGGHRPVTSSRIGRTRK